MQCIGETPKNAESSDLMRDLMPYYQGRAEEAEYGPAAKKKGQNCYVLPFWIGGCAGGRTLDRRIKSPLLYQLSYAPEIL